MNLPSINSSALQGIHQGLDNMRKDAQVIASANTQRDENTKDIADAMVDLNMSARYTEASVKVVKAADEVLGTLLDIIV